MRDVSSDFLTDREHRILKILKKFPYGAKQEDITKELGVSDPTCGNTLDLMVLKKLIKRRLVGGAKLHYLPENYNEVGE